MDRFNEALSVINNALKNFEVKKEEKVRLISQQILIKIKSNDFKNIENYLKKLEKIDPSNLMREKVNEFKKNQDYDDVDDLMKKNIDYSTEFSNLDKFIEYYKNSCEFKGVSAKKSKFTKDDYISVSNLEDVKSSKERAEKTLTAVRIAEKLNFEEEKIKTKLIESLRFQANYYIQINKFDIAKNYLLTILNQIDQFLPVVKQLMDFEKSPLQIYHFYLKIVLTHLIYLVHHLLLLFFYS